MRKRIENVARNVQKILKAAAPRRTKIILPLNWLSFCWKFVFRFLCVFFSLFLLFLSHSLSLSLSLTGVRALFIIQQGRKKLLYSFFNNRSANLYDGNREHFYSLIFILTTSASTRVVFHLIPLLERLVENGKTFLYFHPLLPSFFMFSNYPLFIYSSS